MTANARRLRRDPTEVEKKLWLALRRDQLNGLNFRRQHPVGPYVLDFYCPAIRLAVELDGGQHGEASQQLHDARRTAWLAAKGVRLVRYWNNDVTENLEGVLTDILRMAELRASELTPSPTLPLSGGGNREALP
jgi:very-short-patch-repair endonuclease